MTCITTRSVRPGSPGMVCPQPAWHAQVSVCRASGLQLAALWALIILLVPGPVSASTDVALETVRVVAEEAPLERYFDGTVEAVNQATVSAQTAGRIAAVLYDVDDYVEAGNVLLRFTDVEQRAALNRSDAALREAQARARQADEEFRRVEGLFEAGSGSRREYDQALAAREAARARTASARAEVEEARQQVAYTEVRAPYAGIVTARHVEPGETVGVGQRLMSGLSLEALRVNVDLPQQTSMRVRQNPAARVVTDEGSIRPEEIVLFPFADAATNTFRVRLDLPPGQFGLYPGMFVKVAFEVGTARRLLVPASSLVRRSEVTGIYVIGQAGDIRFRQVRAGAHFGDRIEILAGIKENEAVAVDPVEAAILLKSRAGRDHVE